MNVRPPGGRFDRRRPEQGLRINHRIRVPEVRVIAEEEQLGVMPTHEALRLAEEKGLDLVVETWFSLARVAQPQFAPCFMLVERGTAEPVNQVAPLASHVEHRSSSRRSHILARRQSRMTVSGEMAKASAVS